MDGIVVDVRERPEFAAGHIEGSRLVPLGSLSKASASWDREASLILVCKSGRRAEEGRRQLAAMGFSSVSVLDGEVDAWRAAGRPLLVDERRPWSMERQVRTAAGSLVLATMLLAHYFSGYFLVWTGLVGAGLLFAGVSDTCMMGSALARMPWNRPASPGA